LYSVAISRSSKWFDVVKVGLILGWNFVKSKPQSGHESTDCKAGMITSELFLAVMI
jgi:hypothetical protein